MGLTGVRHELEYIVVQDMAQLGHPITWVCQALSISRSAYYHWLHRTPSARERENRHILDEMRLLYQAYRGIYGYRRLADEYNAIHHTNYNEKRFHRLAKIGNLRAIIRTKQPAPHAAPLMQLCRITIHVLQRNKIEMRKPLNLCYVKATTHQHSTEKKGFPHDHYNTRYEIPSIPDSLR